MSLIFVVSTGRCGSGLLSRLLREHPDVLSLSQSLFGKASLGRRLAGRLDGRQFWKRIADPDPSMDAMVRDGLMVPEFVYPYETGRFNFRTGVPGISHMTLPALTSDPDGLYDVLAAEIPRWPTRSVPDQYRRLWSILSGDHRRSAVVERTCCSIRFVADLRRAFPEARFVYLSRDGVDCALAMSEHAAFRLPVLARLLRAIGQTSPAGPTHPADYPVFDAKLTMECGIPPTAFGAMWSAMTRLGAATLSAMPRDSWISLRFERLVGDPAGTLRDLAQFLGITAPPQWTSWAAGQVVPLQADAPRLLCGAEHAELRAVCAPGYEVDRQLQAAHR